MEEKEFFVCLFFNTAVAHACMPKKSHLDLGREFHGLAENLFAHDVEVSVEERGPAGQHFEGHDAEAPPVDGLAVPRLPLAVQDHFRSEVLGGACVS